MYNIKGHLLHNLMISFALITTITQNHLSINSLHNTNGALLIN